MQIDAVTVLGFFMQWVVLFTVGVLAVWDNFRLRKQVLGPVLLIQCVPCARLLDGLMLTANYLPVMR